MTIIDLPVFSMMLAAAAILSTIQALIPLMIANWITTTFFSRPVPPFALVFVALFAINNLHTLYTRDSYIQFLKHWEVIA